MKTIYKYFKTSSLMLVLLTMTVMSGCYFERDSILGNGGSVEDANMTTVTAVTPLKDATGVAINTKQITASFSKAMDATSLTTSSFTLEQNNVSVTGATVSYVEAGHVVTLTLPAANLASSTVYTATITTEAMALDGIALADNFVWTFTTGSTADITAPTVVSTDAYGSTGTTGGAIGFPVNRSSTATFSESMDPLSITTPPAFTVENTTLGGTAVAGTVTYNVASKTTTFKPTVDLDALTLYTSTITTGAQDLAGNALAVNYVWSWTTGNLADTTRPKVMLTAPLDLAINVPPSQRLQVA